MTKVKVGLALGGGGARGLSHVGVLSVLEEYGIPIDCISGTSIGALIGAGFAIRPNAQELHDRVSRFLTSDEFKSSGLERFKRKEPAENFFGQVAKYVRERIVINLAHHRVSVVSSERLRKVIDFVLDDFNIKDTIIPLAIVATELNTGEGIVMTKGSVRRATVASASIPGFLPPVSYDGFVLVDGAVTTPIPVHAVRDMGANLVIGVDVGQRMDLSFESENIINIIFRTNALAANRLRSLIMRDSDVAIRPAVGHLHWADFGEFEQLVEEGKRACRKAIPQIVRLIREREPLWKKVFASGKIATNHHSNGTTENETVLAGEKVHAREG